MMRVFILLTVHYFYKALNLLLIFCLDPDLHRIGIKLIFVLTRFKCMALIAQAAWLRCLNSAAFASLKKYASHFFNSAFGGTEPKEALYETTGFRCEVLKSKSRTTG